MSTTNETGHPTDLSGVPSGGVRGPVLVSLGAAGWGAENFFRSRLGGLGLSAYPIVVAEHLLQIVFTLPLLVRHRAALRTASRRALGYVFLSGAVGSALGTVCYTAALGTSMNKTVAAVLLNLQPLVSTLAGAVLFREAITRRFFTYAPMAIAAGMVMALPGDGKIGAVPLPLQGGLALVGGTVLAWGFATAAGRGAMRELPLGLAAPLRLWSGLLTASLVLGARVALGVETPNLGALLAGPVLWNLVLLTTLTGVVPLLVYFAGLRSTPASIAGYCEMLYTVSAVLVGWLLLGDKLLPHQALAGGVLLFAVVMLNRSHDEGSAPAEPEARAA